MTRPARNHLAARLGLCLLLLWALAFAGPGRAAPRLEIAAPSPQLAREVERMALKSAPLLRQLTGAQPENMRIEILPTLEKFKKRVQQVGGPLWAAGLALPRQGLILLRSPSQLTDPEGFGLVLVHEMTHLYLHAALREKRLPLWLEEGVAMYASGQGGLANAGELAGAVLTDGLIPLGRMQDSFPASASQARLAYAQSYYLVSFLLNRYGPDTPAAIIRELARGRDLTVALKIVTGHGVAALEKEFIQEMDSRFSWLAAIFATGTVWGLAALLAGVGLVHRRRAQLREMHSGREAAEAPDIPPGRRLRPPAYGRSGVLKAAGLAKR